MGVGVVIPRPPSCHSNQNNFLLCILCERRVFVSCSREGASRCAPNIPRRPRQGERDLAPSSDAKGDREELSLPLQPTLVE